MWGMDFLTSDEGDRNSLERDTIEGDSPVDLTYEEDWECS